MTPRGERILAMLADRLIDDHSLREELGPIEQIAWDEDGDAIVAEIGARSLRVDRTEITITTPRFSSSKTIPLA